MKGIINKGIEAFVKATFSDETWAQIKRKAGCKEPFFSASEDYPEQTTVDLVSAASEISGLDTKTVLFEFGKFWLLNTAADAYPTLFRLSGKTTREFLLNMNRVHDQVTRSLPNAKPPSFDYEELPDGRLLMHYQSERMLCPLLKGLILGVSAHFDEQVEVKETACMSNGDSRCTMEVTFDGSQ